MRDAYRIDFTEGSIVKNLIRFTIPLILSNLIQQFYNTADQIVVGKYSGEIALAAVGATSTITNLILTLFICLSVGATVMCAKYCGAFDMERTSKTVHSSMCIACVGGVIATLIGVISARPLLVLMDVPKEILAYSVRYMTIIFAGVPFSLIFNFGSGILRARGDTKRPLYILAFTGFINVVLNMLFVIVFGMDEVGVALATIISQIISAAIVVYMLTKTNDIIRLDIKKLRFHKQETLDVLRIGIPAGLNIILYNFTEVVLQSTINTFGTVYIAANSVTGTITSYIGITHTAISNSMLSFAGQNHGAKKYLRIKKAIVVSIIMSLVISIAVITPMLLFPREILRVFTDEIEVVEAGVVKLIIMSLSFLLNGPLNVFGGTLRGIEKPNFPFLTSLVAICVVRIIWIGFVFPLHPTFDMIFYCYSISWFFAMIAQGSGSFYFINKLDKKEKSAVSS